MSDTELRLFERAADEAKDLTSVLEFASAFERVHGRAAAVRRFLRCGGTHGPSFCRGRIEARWWPSHTPDGLHNMVGVSLECENRFRYDQDNTMNNHRHTEIRLMHNRLLRRGEALFRWPSGWDPLDFFEEWLPSLGLLAFRMGAGTRARIACPAKHEQKMLDLDPRTQGIDLDPRTQGIDACIAIGLGVGPSS